MSDTRRRFLRRAGGAAVAAGGLGAVGSSRASAQATVRGRLVASDGSGVGGRRLKNYGESEFDIVTDDDGSFEATVSPGARMKLTLYKSHYGELSGLAPTRNQVPHVYVVGEYYSEEGTTDLGNITLPEASLVRLRALNRDGTPVEDATPGVRHDGAGIGSYWVSTRSDGWAYIKRADFDGIELAGRVQLSMAVPTDGGGEMVYRERVTVDGPMKAVFQIGKGVTVTKKYSSGTPATTPTDTPTATPTETPTASPTTAVETDTSTPFSTETATPRVTATRTATATPGPQRGFFSNGPDASDLGPLDDPVFLTVGGFALSVAGIAHQMIRGY